MEISDSRPERVRNCSGVSNALGIAFLGGRLVVSAAIVSSVQYRVLEERATRATEM